VVSQNITVPPMSVNELPPPYTPQGGLPMINCNTYCGFITDSTFNNTYCGFITDSTFNNTYCGFITDSTFNNTYKLTNFITKCQYRVHLTLNRFELTTLVVIGTDCTCSYKSNYHMITTTTAPTRMSGSPVSLLQQLSSPNLFSWLLYLYTVGHDCIFCVNHHFQKFVSYTMTTRILWRGQLL
jgi:hypothetical protein